MRSKASGCGPQVTRGRGLLGCVSMLYLNYETRGAGSLYSWRSHTSNLILINLERLLLHRVVNNVHGLFFLLTVSVLQFCLEVKLKDLLQNI